MSHVMRLQPGCRVAARVRAAAVALQQRPVLAVGDDAVGTAEVADVAGGVVDHGADAAGAQQALDDQVR